MARPKKDESIRRTKNVMVRFTDVEYALVSCSAEQAGYPVAVYVRKQAITEKLHVHYNIVADIAELRDFARQLSHIGNNLNQVLPKPDKSEPPRSGGTGREHHRL